MNMLMRSPETTTTFEDPETGWSVEIDAVSVSGEYGMYALLRNQILALQARVSALEGHGDDEFRRGQSSQSVADAEQRRE